MAILNLDISQGSTFELLLLVKDVNKDPLDMTLYSGGTAGARGMIRKKYSDTSPIETFTISILNKTGVLAAIAVSQCHITDEEIAALEPDTSGKCYLLIRLTAAETAALAKGVAYYDIEIEDTYGFVFKPITGTVTIGPEATKA